jgi:hypothetical protein
MIPEEDKQKLLFSIKKEKQDAIEELKKIFTYNYTQETKLIFLDAETFEFGLGWQALAHSNVTDEVPLYFKNNRPIHDCIASASCGFHHNLDYDEIFQNDQDEEYFSIGKQLYAKWLSDLYHELTQEYQFKLPILLGFREDSLLYSLDTGEYKEEDEWEEELFDN